MRSILRNLTAKYSLQVRAILDEGLTLTDSFREGLSYLLYSPPHNDPKNLPLRFVMTSNSYGKISSTDSSSVVGYFEFMRVIPKFRPSKSSIVRFDGHLAVTPDYLLSKLKVHTEGTWDTGIYNDHLRAKRGKTVLESKLGTPDYLTLEILGFIRRAKDHSSWRSRASPSPSLESS